MTEPEKPTAAALVPVAFASNQAEAEMIQGMLEGSQVSCLIRRSGSADVPDYLAAGGREVLVRDSDLAVARNVLNVPITDDLVERPQVMPAPGKLLIGVLAGTAALSLLALLMYWLT